MNTALDSIEWHDLPVVQISILGSGVSLIVETYDEGTASYKSHALNITDAESFKINFAGALSKKDLESLEVSSFNYSTSNSGRISGTLGLLPGEAGFWELSFIDASWSLDNA